MKLMSTSHSTKRPFVQGDVVDATIVGLLKRGGSEAEVGDRRVRVLGGVPGDQAEIRITHVGKNISTGRIVELKEASPDRVEAPCPVVDRCGGCPWQMVSVEAQRRTKEENLRALLKGVTEDAFWHPWAGPSECVGYRTRALMILRHRAGKLRMGFYAPGSNDLVSIERCVVQNERLNQTLEKVLLILGSLPFSSWRGPERPGLLRAVLLRVDPDIGKGLLTIVISKKPTSMLRTAVDKIVKLPGVTGVYALVNASDGGAMLAGETVHLKGAIRQKIIYGDLRLEVGPVSFLQTQHRMGTALVEWVAKLLPKKMEHLADFFAGVGVFGLAMSERAGKVTLVESSHAAAQDARYNVERLGASKTDVLEGDASDHCGILTKAEPAVDAAVVDPPRSGCRPELLNHLIALPSLKVLVYISCDPKTLARDLEQLKTGGFRATDVIPLDMFVHTPHMETVVRLERSE
jgi:23S rRNA (uracil1939-C5)-methyltransferase